MAYIRHIFSHPIAQSRRVVASGRQVVKLWISWPRNLAQARRSTPTPDKTTSAGVEGVGVGILAALFFEHRWVRRAGTRRKYVLSRAHLYTNGAHDMRKSLIYKPDDYHVQVVRAQTIKHKFSTWHV